MHLDSRFLIWVRLDIEKSPNLDTVIYAGIQSIEYRFNWPFPLQYSYSSICVYSLLGLYEIASNIKSHLY